MKSTTRQINETAFIGEEELTFRFLDFYKRPATHGLVFRPPPVIRARRPVHRPLHHAVEGLSLLAGSVALPPMSFVECDLVMKVVVNGDIGAGLLVDSEHVLVEGGAMSIVVVVAISDEEVRVNHLVQERLNKVLSRPQFEQRHGESD